MHNKFADGRNLVQVKDKTKRDLNRLEPWAERKKMEFNKKKGKVLDRKK